MTRRKLVSRQIASAAAGTVSPARLADKAVGIACDAKAPAAARTTAFQVAAHLGDRRILGVARTNAKTAASIPLRLSAIAALGQVGEARDAAILETISVGETENKYIKGAAVAGLKQLRSRNDLKQAQ
jgi:hypothetical protein